ncbi:hypothetical protein [Saccharopolyspora sp. NPDC002686]|uniref:hypothetical protein n=1 Tax=Saccharopolyspora sp. NPDC002686 TaxID=3154541 RepID=UPI003333EE70
MNTESGISPSWLADGALELLGRFNELRTQATRLAMENDLDGYYDQLAAVARREAVLWRVLTVHTTDPLLLKAMEGAWGEQEQDARRFREAAQEWRARVKVSLAVEEVAA